MNTTTDPLDTFETQLLATLRAEVADRAAAPPPHTPHTHRTRRRWAVAGAGAAALATAIGATSLLQPNGAYAVEEKDNGDIVVTIRSLEDADGLERALGDRGVDAEVDYDRVASLPDPDRDDPGGQGRAGESKDDDGASGSVVEPGDMMRIDDDGCFLTIKRSGSDATFQLPAKIVHSDSGATLHIATSETQDGASNLAVRWEGGKC